MPPRSGRPARPSAHAVAQLAGVSQAAVSRAFTPGASIAEATRERVLRAAEQLGYRPNLLARSLIKGESGIVGLVIGNVLDPLSAKAFDVLSARLAREGKHILVFTADEGEDADRQVEDLLRYRVDALLLMASNLSPALAERCHREGIPVVFFNRQFGKVRKFSSVFGDSAEGARQLAGHLVGQGYRHIAVMTGHAGSSTSFDRERGFIEALTAQGRSPAACEPGYCSREGAIAAARALLARKRRPDAIFCVNDTMALATIEVARFEYGLSIGPELGVAGFDDVDQAAWPSFDLTTYSYPVEAMVELALQNLLAKPDGRRSRHCAIAGELKQRGSTRRA